MNLNVSVNYPIIRIENMRCEIIAEKKSTWGTYKLDSMKLIKEYCFMEGVPHMKYNCYLTIASRMNLNEIGRTTDCKKYNRGKSELKKAS